VKLGHPQVGQGHQHPDRDENEPAEQVGGEQPAAERERPADKPLDQQPDRGDNRDRGHHIGERQADTEPEADLPGGDEPSSQSPDGLSFFRLVPVTQ